MIILRFKKTEDDLRYPSDVDRISRVLMVNGYCASATDIQLAWEAYSDSMCAGWMMLPEDDEELFNTVYSYLELA